MLRFLTAGESHGKGLVTVIEGMVAGLPLTVEDIAHDLRRRRDVAGRSQRMKIEGDPVEILSGVRHGYTLGSPISLLIPNAEWQRWAEAMAVEPHEPAPPVTRPRPGHADLAGTFKYGFGDIRNVLERASARETAARVAAGAVARRFLAEFGIKILSHTVCIGDEWAQVEAPDPAVVETSPVRCADPEAGGRMLALIEEARASGETLGGVFEVIAYGVPPGLGSYVHWDRRLDGRLAQALMSIPAVKGVESGAGFRFASLKGSEAHDPILPGFKRGSNRAGGIEGGVSNGQPIVLRGAVKPVPTLPHPLPSVDIITGEPSPGHYERADVCIVPAVGVIAEAMVAWVLAEAFQEKFGGDSLEETKRNYRNYIETLPEGVRP